MYFNNIYTQGYDKMVHFRMFDDETNAKMCEADCGLKYCPNLYLRNLSRRKRKEIYYFNNFGTFPAYRGKGYARKMLQYVKEYYKGKIVYLYVGASPGGSLNDEQLIKFYKSEGFRMYKSNCWPLMAIEL